MASHSSWRPVSRHHPFFTHRDGTFRCSHDLLGTCREACRETRPRDITAPVNTSITTTFVHASYVLFLYTLNATQYTSVKTTQDSLAFADKVFPLQQQYSVAEIDHHERAPFRLGRPTKYYRDRNGFQSKGQNHNTGAATLCPRVYFIAWSMADSWEYTAPVCCTFAFALGTTKTYARRTAHLPYTHSCTGSYFEVVWCTSEQTPQRKHSHMGLYRQVIVRRHHTTHNTTQNTENRILMARGSPAADRRLSLVLLVSALLTPD